MLPTEPPLSLHRLVAPVPPARTQETATATRQVPAPAPVPVSNAAVAHGMHALAGTASAAAQDQLGNAAMAKAAAQAAPAVPLLVMPLKTQRQ
ncbi:hypothetical protein GCM10010246_67980 [Streptomyces cuspidosporus]|uniref:Uncharacterized protein n=1 Tax=Streptomyces cuspidosporus TaxID=66882 RepID=A0ABP5TZY6_9ACTN